MYEVTYVLDGVQRKMSVNANDAVTAQKMFTNYWYKEDLKKCKKEWNKFIIN